MTKKFTEALPVQKSGPDKHDAGVDEAGRGCLFGPVVVAACILPSDCSNILLRDSKKLSEPQRKEAYEWIKENALSYSVQFVDNKIIDQRNILDATMLGMNRAIADLSFKPDKVLIDGNRFKLMAECYRRVEDLPDDVETVVKGDDTFACISAASILAKVSRDNYIESIADKYHEDFDFVNNKGYASPKHKMALLENGPTDKHRRSFKLDLNSTFFFEEFYKKNLDLFGDYFEVFKADNVAEDFSSDTGEKIMKDYAGEYLVVSKKEELTNQRESYMHMYVSEKDVRTRNIVISRICLSSEVTKKDLVDCYRKIAEGFKEFMFAEKLIGCCVDDNSLF